MPGFWANHLGIVDLTLQQVDGEWQVVDSQSEARPISERVDGATVSLVDIVPTDRRRRCRRARERRAPGSTSPSAEAAAPMVSFFALVQDDPSIQIVTDAQKWYTERIVQGTELDGLPITLGRRAFQGGPRRRGGLYGRARRRPRIQERCRPVPLSQHGEGAEDHRHGRARMAGDVGRTV